MVVAVFWSHACVMFSGRRWDLALYTGMLLLMFLRIVRAVWVSIWFCDCMAVSLVSACAWVMSRVPCGVISSSGVPIVPCGTWSSSAAARISVGVDPMMVKVLV